MQGLTDAEVQERIARGQVNTQNDSQGKSFRQICRENILTYFNLIFLVITILVLIAGHFTVSDFLFLPVVISNALVGIFQEWRSQKTLNKLTIISVPEVTVIRNSRKTKIHVDQLVVDDCLLLHAGDQISVDADVVEGAISADEAILTGEADEIEKQPGDKLYSGNFVVSGDCTAKVTKVGAETYAAQLISQAKDTDQDNQGEMVRAINSIVKWIGIIIVPLGVAMVVQSMYVNHLSFQWAIAGMVAAVIGMIPEGLDLLVTVALATSAVRLARKKVLLHNMHSIEKLSRVDTLCIDKTGTITEPDMKLEKVIPLKEGVSETTMAAQIFQFSPDNETMIAMQDYFEKPQSLPQPVRLIPFKSANKYSAVVYADHTYTFGAPENLLLDDYQNYASQIEEYSTKGYRVLLFGDLDQSVAGDTLGQAVNPLALFILRNPIRENAPATFKYFAQQAVDIKVISGDNPQTVAAVANQAGIAGADSYVDARTLDTEEKVAEGAERYTIFGRVTPERKRQLVEALQEKGHTVAMTGDGVNDILAMRKADCSIAMASGSSAAMQAAQMVLLKSDFAMMPSIVNEGRQTINNIQRSASLFLIKNIFSFFLAVLTIFTSLAYPLRSSQVSLISAFMIGIPGYLLTLEPDYSPIKKKFVRTVFSNAFPAAMVDVFAIGLLIVVGHRFDLPSADVSTVSALIMAFVGLAMLIYLAQPLTIIRGITIFISTAGFIAAVTLMGDLFRVVRPNHLVVILGLVFLLAAEAVLVDLLWLVQYFNDWRRRRKSKPGMR